MKSVRILANAKINLSLDVLGKRPDGYHSVRMIMQEIPLADDVRIDVSNGDGIEIFCNTPGVPCDERNLAHKAARIFADETKIKANIKIFIDKKIPAAAGMAGGSSDAAAALKGLNRIFGEPLSGEDLLKLGLKIGADVPFCIRGGCAVAEGIGEVLTPAPPLKNAFLVVAKPDFAVSTKWVYENLDLGKVEKRPQTEKVIEGLKSGNLRKIADSTANVLESVTEREYPVISEYKDCMITSGAVFAMMSGSGPTVFGVFDHESNAKAAYSLMESKTKDSFLLKL